MPRRQDDEHEDDDDLDFSQLARQQSNGNGKRAAAHAEADDDLEDEDLEGDEGDDLDEQDEDTEEEGGEEEGLTPQQAATLRSYLASKNYQVPETLTDDQLYEQVEQQLTRAAQLQQQVAQYQGITPQQAAEFAQNKSDYERWRAEQQAAAQPEKGKGSQAAAPAGPEWNPPAIDELSRQLVQHGIANGKIEQDPASGLLVSDDVRYQAAVNDFNRHESYRRDKLKGWTENPYEFIGQAVEPKLTTLREQLKQELLAELQQTTQSFRAQDSLSQFSNQHGLAFVQLDEKTGQPLIDPQTQSYIPNEAGIAYWNAGQQAMATLRAFGQQIDPNNLTPQQQYTIHQIALQAAQPYLQQASAPAAKRDDGKKKRKNLRQAARAAGSDTGRAPKQGGGVRTSSRNHRRHRNGMPSLRQLIRQTQQEDDDLD